MHFVSAKSAYLIGQDEMTLNMSFVIGIFMFLFFCIDCIGILSIYVCMLSKEEIKKTTPGCINNNIINVNKRGSKIGELEIAFYFSHVWQ